MATKERIHFEWGAQVCLGAPIPGVRQAGSMIKYPSVTFGSKSKQALVSGPIPTGQHANFGRGRRSAGRGL